MKSYSDAIEILDMDAKAQNLPMGGLEAQANSAADAGPVQKPKGLAQRGLVHLSERLTTNDQAPDQLMQMLGANCSR